jgi:ribosomal protein S18 acetylase RimI-like enzyme
LVNLTLIADASTLARSEDNALPGGFLIRASTEEDVDQIGALYFLSYPSGDACATEHEAVAEVAASFGGEYGEYLSSASPVVVRGDELVAAVMTVRLAPWPDTPSCPFIIELFTHPVYRRLGFGKALLRSAARATASIDRSIALRVEEQNGAARALYDRLGFRLWTGAGDR